MQAEPGSPPSPGGARDSPIRLDVASIGPRARGRANAPAWSRGIVVLAAVAARADSVPARTFSQEEPREATASRTTSPPRLDGRDDDGAWRLAPIIDDFRMYAPRENADPTVRTEARVLFDRRYLYVLVRSYDERPDSVVGLLARRDTNGPPNDQVLLFIDSFHDRRSGYCFIVTAAGVKSDCLVFDDGQTDSSWDGIWDVATAVDSLGWVAEYAIPLQQLRFSDRVAPTFGIMIGRWVGRTDERVSWPLYSPSRAGLASQFAVLRGLRDLGGRTAIEMIPYALVRTRSGCSTPHPGAPNTEFAVGGDLRWLPRPDISLNATVNPDFGQVEADPAVLDLTGAEVFQTERRPFFLEGAGLFNLSLGADGPILLFYSRRIGRRPSLLDTHGAPDSPTQTTILAATKTTARPSPATSVGMLSAVTGVERGATRPHEGGRYLIEPLTHYGVARLQRDFRGGRSGVGVMLTRVDRALEDSLMGAVFPSSAQTLAVTTQHQNRDGEYQVLGLGAASRLAGSAAALSSLQLSPVHAFQRPDDGSIYDPTRRALRGTAALVSVAKVGGGVTRFAMAFRRIAPGFDPNDIGFLKAAGVQSLSAEAGLAFTRAGRALGIDYRSANVTLGFDGEWATAGLPYGRALRVTTSLQTPGQARVQGHGVAQLSGAYCSYRCTRGGPALYDPPRRTVQLEYAGTPRATFVPHLQLTWDRDDEGASHGQAVQADATWRIRNDLNASLAVFALDADHAWDHYATFGDALSDTAHYAVARLDLATRSITARVDYTMRTTLSLQWYAQAHISRGAYSDVREVAEPRARTPVRRFTPYPDSAVTARPGGIDFKQLRSNLVLRWEYAPGSTIFLVWSHTRDVAGREPADPGLWPGRDLADLFRAPASNTLVLKGSLWLSL